MDVILAMQRKIETAREDVKMLTTYEAVSAKFAEIDWLESERFRLVMQLEDRYPNLDTSRLRAFKDSPRPH